MAMNRQRRSLNLGYWLFLCIAFWPAYLLKRPKKKRGLTAELETIERRGNIAIILVCLLVLCWFLLKWEGKL